MAKAPEKINRLKKPRTFSCCFGVSQKEIFSDKISSVKSSNSSRETTGMLYWSIFRMKNSSAKTVPLDSSDKITDLSETKIRSSKSSNFKFIWNIQRLFTKRTNSATKAMPFREVPTIVKEIIEETTTERYNTLESRKSFDHVHTSKDATCRSRLLFRRKINARRTGSSQPGLPNVTIEPSPKPAPTNTAATLSHPVSMPVSNRENRAKPPSKARVVPKKTRHDGNVMDNKFDPVVGMSIIVVTLIIMLIWGRFCAILCTSAWLYFVPRLRALKNDDATTKINDDLDSEEYKRRVVLKGFLERDHRAVTVVL